MQIEDFRVDIIDLVRILSTTNGKMPARTQSHSRTPGMTSNRPTMYPGVGSGPNLCLELTT